MTCQKHPKAGSSAGKQKSVEITPINPCIQPAHNRVKALKAAWQRVRLSSADIHPWPLLASHICNISVHGVKYLSVTICWDLAALHSVIQYNHSKHGKTWKNCINGSMTMFQFAASRYSCLSIPCGSLKRKSRH